MTRKTRFTLWAVVVQILLPGQCYAIAKFDSVAVWAVVISAFLLIVFLLYTTPPDAIRLYRWVSDLLIFSGSLILWGFVIETAASNHPFARVTIAAVIVSATALWQIKLRRKRQSPWWAVVIGWNPLLIFAAGRLLSQ